MQILLDRAGNRSGTIDTMPDGVLVAFDKAGNRLGYYDPRLNLTSDRSGQRVGAGNLLSFLVLPVRNAMPLEHAKSEDACHGPMARYLKQWCSSKGRRDYADKETDDEFRHAPTEILATPFKPPWKGTDLKKEGQTSAAGGKAVTGAYEQPTGHVAPPGRQVSEEEDEPISPEYHRKFNKEWNKVMAAHLARHRERQDYAFPSNTNAAIPEHYAATLSPSALSNQAIRQSRAVEDRDVDEFNNQSGVLPLEHFVKRHGAQPGNASELFRLHHEAQLTHQQAAEAARQSGQAQGANFHEDFATRHGHRLDQYRPGATRQHAQTARQLLQSKHGQNFPEDTPPGVLADALADHNENEHEQKLRDVLGAAHLRRQEPWQKYAQSDPPTQGAPIKDENVGYAKKLSKAAKEATANAHNYHNQWEEAHDPSITRKRPTHRELAEMLARNYAHGAHLHKQAYIAAKSAGDETSASTHEQEAGAHEQEAQSFQGAVTMHDKLAKALMKPGFEALHKKHGKKFDEDTPPLILADALHHHGESELAKKIRSSEHVSHHARKEPWMAYVKDTSGHEHKTSGSGGGQFAKTAGGSSQEASAPDHRLMARILMLARRMNDNKRDPKDLLDEVAGPKEAQQSYAKVIEGAVAPAEPPKAGVVKQVGQGLLSGLKAGATIAAGVATAGDPHAHGRLRTLLGAHDKNRGVDPQEQRSKEARGQHHQRSLLVLRNRHALKLEAQKHQNRLELEAVRGAGGP